MGGSPEMLSLSLRFSRSKIKQKLLGQRSEEQKTAKILLKGTLHSTRSARKHSHSCFSLLLSTAAARWILTSGSVTMAHTERSISLRRAKYIPLPFYYSAKTIAA
ncbi:hypothetical protein AV530_016919 [Patagioenas fasciata monilis]|uniref:Uncharacterized protein n=1 Tax=Patagioenas fasciata monilis TaxID=372326 RepID=A0A1V4J481_PATFA|nr:hypothetical protein AV530_016919 [Patagioenas fasciata monilis]